MAAEPPQSEGGGDQRIPPSLTVATAPRSDEPPPQLALASGVRAAGLPQLKRERDGRAYARIENPCDWHEAMDLCKQLDAHLVTIDGAAENDWVYNAFAVDNVISLGGTDERSEGRFQWVTAEPFQFAAVAGKRKM